MKLFSKGVARWVVLSVALVVFLVVPPEALGRGSGLCLWKHVLRVAACPACGSTRALAAFFHGHLVQAFGYNRNIVVTGPLLLILLAQDAARHIRKLAAR